jgi:hypothetical protein
VEITRWENLCTAKPLTPSKYYVDTRAILPRYMKAFAWFIHLNGIETNINTLALLVLKKCKIFIV